MSRIIRYFDKASESFVNEIVLPEIPLAKLQQLFDVAIDNPMYDSFPIDEQKEPFFKDYVNVEFLLDNFDYYLEYDA